MKDAGLMKKVVNVSFSFEILIIFILSAFLYLFNATLGKKIKVFIENNGKSCLWIESLRLR